MLPRWAVIGLAALISTMWAVNLIVGYLYPDRSDPALNAIFAIVAGAVFGLDRIAARRGGTEPREIPPDDSDDRGGQS